MTTWQPGRKIVHQTLHQFDDVGHVAHKVIVVQHQNRLAAQPGGHGVKEGRQHIRRHAPVGFFQHLQRALSPSRFVQAHGADKVCEKEQGVSVRFGDGIPEEVFHGIGQATQSRALAVAGARLNDGQWIVHDCGQARVQAWAAQHLLPLPGRHKLALDHQVFQHHGTRIIALNGRNDNPVSQRDRWESSQV